MTIEGPGGTGWQREQPTGATTQDDDDLDRAFGTETGAVATRSGPQRVRSWSLLVVGVVVAAVVIVVVLGLIVSSVQNGVGGIVPRPERSAAQFTADVRDVSGIASAKTAEPTKTSLISYDVVTALRADEDLSHARRAELVRQVSGAAASSSGTGVHVYAVTDFGDVVVGVSESADVSAERLAVAEDVKAIGGVLRVHCVWDTDHEGGARSDDAKEQRVIVETAGTGVGLAAVADAAQKIVLKEFPGATVLTAVPGSV
ncbi:hypothetical protein BIU98_01640 [Curtobacterium sp. MMLR14_010]|uniref:hypothetical protein n=1 Tax=Curtobacterium sp. MMLR14_010 TaxID=1898743 RepID=UPI0008DDFDDF|nr:hypothetical protein [Curtobacterium sp. MMLR14_010]OII34706.1 hypothetical protein BIU98_01640 [Curtobacterium sp. MMLR14_010]